MTQPKTDLLSQIRNAILDLQSADYQGLSLPLQKLGRLLSHPDVERVNQTLTEGLDVEKFIADGAATQGSMVGSAELPWPNDDRQILGFQLLLILKFSNHPDALSTFGHQFYYGGNKIMGSVGAVISQIIIPFERDYRAYVVSKGKVETKLVLPQSNKVFIVHGHDEAASTAAVCY